MNQIAKIVPYYWIFFTVYAFFRMRYGVYSRVDTIYEICMLLCVLYECRTLRWKLVDRLVLIFVFYSFLSCLSMSFSYEIINDWFRAMAFGTLGYFVARGMKQNQYRIFDTMKFVFPAICIIALFLYFHPTSWYLNYKLNYEKLSDYMIIELTRLSGFWEYPYFISYGCFIYLTYFSLKYYNQGLSLEKSMYAFFPVVALACFFAQQRVAIVFVICLYALFHFLLFISKRYSIKKLLVCDIIIILFSGSFVVALKNVVSLDTFDYIVERMVEGTIDRELVTTRFDMFADESSIKDMFIGDGYGSHSRSSNSAISDNQFLNIYAEFGIIGFILLYLPIVCSLFKAIRRHRFYLFELCILLFYLAAMTGANPINSPDLHPFLFWYCLGLINNNRYSQIQIKNNEKNNSNSSSSILKKKKK